MRPTQTAPRTALTTFVSISYPTAANGSMITLTSGGNGEYQPPPDRGTSSSQG